MKAQQLANALLPLLPKISVPMSLENAQATAMIYDTLLKMSRGELVLTRPVESTTAPGPPVPLTPEG